jgi:tetratricopeptide (TPR) repeat protein
MHDDSNEQLRNLETTYRSPGNLGNLGNLADSRSSENNGPDSKPRVSTISKLSFAKSRGLKTSDNRGPAGPAVKEESKNGSQTHPSTIQITEQSACGNSIETVSNFKLAGFVVLPNATPQLNSNEPSHAADYSGNHKSNFAPRGEAYLTSAAVSQEEIEQAGKELQSFDPEQLASAYEKKKLLIYAATILVMIGAIVYIAASCMHMTQTTRPLACFLLFAPICIVLSLKEASKRIGRRNPMMAQRLCRWLSFGNPLALSHLASLYMDTGNYSKAAKVLHTASRTVQPKNINDYITTHAKFAAVRARIASIAEAEELFKESFNSAVQLKQARPTPSSSLTLVVSLICGAEIEACQSNYQKAFELSRRALTELSQVEKPPVDLVLDVLEGLGHYSNAVGRWSETELYLLKAVEITDKLKDVSNAQKARILAHLGLALFRLRYAEASEHTFAESLKLAETKAASGAVPHIISLYAKVQSARKEYQEADQSYKDAIAAYNGQDPKVTHELLQIKDEYAFFLRTLGKEGEAAAVALSVTQAGITLEQQKLAKTAQNAKKREQIKPAAAPQINRAAAQQINRKYRFPIFMLLIVMFYGSLVLLEGLRVASFHSWAWFIGFATVLAIKLRAKYGARSVEETNSALVSILSHLPFSRYIVPELSVLPQRTVAIFVGCALLVAGVLKVTLPPPDTVPPGLTSYEYFTLGTSLNQKESFNKARDAYQRAADQHGHFGTVAERLLKLLPVGQQPDEAISLNMQAVALKKDKVEAEKIWKDCIAKYPNFEIPYLHLGEYYLKSKDKQKLSEAQEMIAHTLSINPDSQNALFDMYRIKKGLGDDSGAQQYLDKVPADQRELIESLDKMSDDLEKKEKKGGDTDEDN